MVLRHTSDVAQADWFAQRPFEVDDEDLWSLVLQGPPGYATYTTIFFDTDEGVSYRSDNDVVALVTRLAAAFTSTADDAFFGLWDGWADLTEPSRYTSLRPRENWFGRFFRAGPLTRAQSAFDRSVVNAPRVNIGDVREYLLFRGAVNDVGQWNARPYAPDWPRELPQASLTWPRDRAWFIASDVDPSWFCAAGPQELADALASNSELRTETATYGTTPPVFDE